MDNKDKQISAYHEAGHAVANYIFSREFECVTMLLEDNTSDHLARHGLGNAAAESMEYGSVDDAGTRQKLESFVMSILAGEAAVYIMLGEIGMKASNKDFMVALDMTSKVSASVEGVRYLLRLRIRIGNILAKEQLKAAIQALADAILQRDRIEYNEARSIIKQVIGNYHYEWCCQEDDAAA